MTNSTAPTTTQDPTKTSSSDSSHPPKLARGNWITVLAPPEIGVPTKLPSWMHLWSRSAASGGAIIATIAVFIWLHHASTFGSSVAAFVVGGQVLVALGALPFSAWYGRTYRRLDALLDSGVDSEELPRRDVLAALRLPTRIFWIIWTVHIVFAVIFVAVSFFVDGWADAVVDVALGAVALGFISAATQFHIMNDEVRGKIAPRLIPRGRLDHLANDDGGIDLTYVWQHLSILIASMAIAWPVLLFTLFRAPGDASVAKYVLLILLFVVVTTVQAAGIMRTVAGGVGHLAARMEEVRGGHLEVKARVFQLDTFGMQASHFNRMVEGLQQREQLKEAFGRYVTQQVADEVLAGRVALGGELRTATVLFSDIRGFTTMSEKMSPQEVVAFLNDYLAAMVDVVIEHGGVLDKFIGDAVMAVFGVPVSRGSAEDDAKAAVDCAVAMGKQLDAMNARRVERGLEPIKIGIGVHTGELVAGNIGSPRRMQYTVIGDTVNVGSRLESLTKEHKRRTLLSEATARLVKDKVDVVEVGTVPVRGRDELLVIFGLVSEAA